MMARVTRARLSSERGESLMSFLVGTALVTVIFGAALNAFLDASHSSLDLRVKARAEEQAKTILDLMAYELRMLGSGMPLGQTGFAIGDAALGSAPLPVLLTSSSSRISFRLNETGAETVLVSDFTPGPSARTFSVASAADLDVGDTVYISDHTAGGTNGLSGVVEATSGATVTLANGFVSTSSAMFGAGSLVSRVTNVTFDSPADWSGVTRDPETGAVVLAPNSSFTVEYLDSSGAAIAIPLTSSSVADNLTSIRLTVSVRGDAELRSGGIYTATAVETIALRNLNMNR